MRRSLDIFEKLEFLWHVWIQSARIVTDEQNLPKDKCQRKRGKHHEDVPGYSLKNMQNVENRKLYGDGFIHMRLTKGTIQWIEVGTRGDWYSCKSDHPLSSGDFRTLPNITPAIAPSHCGKPVLKPLPIERTKETLAVLREFCCSFCSASSVHIAVELLPRCLDIPCTARSKRQPKHQTPSLEPSLKR